MENRNRERTGREEHKMKEKLETGPAKCSTHLHIRDCSVAALTFTVDTVNKTTHLDWKSPDYKLQISVSKKRVFVSLIKTLPFEEVRVGTGQMKMHKSTCPLTTYCNKAIILEV